MSNPRRSELPSDRGADMLRTYADRYGYTEPQPLNPDDAYSFLGDLVADLLHYAAARGISDGFLSMAEAHYVEERQESHDE